MLKYKNKYATKAISVFGEPQLSIIKRLSQYVEIKEDTSILIPNCQDGIYVLPLSKKSNNITCYEESTKLLDGGVIDQFLTLGLIKRLKGAKLAEHVKVKKYNFFHEKQSYRYDLVLAIRTIQLKENNKWSISKKLKSLMNSVNENGFLYLNYYLDEDIEVSKNQILRYKQIMGYIDLKKWNVIYHKENYIRGSVHNKHPFNKKEHTHKVGSILLQKTPNNYKKRTINRVYRTSSIFGQPNQQIYDYILFFQKKYNRNIDLLIVDANDGKNVLPFARRNYNVVCYEDNDVLINGGIFNGKFTNGLKKRISDFSLEDKVEIKQINYYCTKEIKKFDLVYVENSLNLDKNKNISMKKKVRKLMSNVREGGYIYIYYDLIVDNCLEKSNLYLNSNEMKTYFDKEDWKIVYICEREHTSICHYSENRKIGYIFAMKKRNRNNFNDKRIRKHVLDNYFKGTDSITKFPSKYKMEKALKNINYEMNYAIQKFSELFNSHDINTKQLK